MLSDMGLVIAWIWGRKAVGRNLTQRQNIRRHIAQVAGKNAPTSLSLLFEINPLDVERELSIVATGSGPKLLGQQIHKGSGNKEMCLAWEKQISKPWAEKNTFLSRKVASGLSQPRFSSKGSTMAWTKRQVSQARSRVVDGRPTQGKMHGESRAAHEECLLCHWKGAENTDSTSDNGGGGCETKCQ